MSRFKKNTQTSTLVINPLVGVDLKKILKFNENPLNGRRFSKKYSNIKFNENPLVGVDLKKYSNLMKIR